MTTGLAKAAKVLTAPQIKQLLRFTETTAYPKRNRVMVLLSFKAALRAKEIGMLTWAMVTDAEGALVTSMSLTNPMSNGKFAKGNSTSSVASGGSSRATRTSTSPRSLKAS